MSEQNRDTEYSELLLAPLRTCLKYLPKMGTGSPTSSSEFIELYSKDPFYSWMGLDNPLLYAAHKAAGGQTSLYRQLGIGCERLFRRVIQDHCRLSDEQANWSYELPTAGKKKPKTLSLDARIDISDMGKTDVARRMKSWIEQMRKELSIQVRLRGAVFEVRQGYKSKDSKRQNADIDNAANALKAGYLPVLVLFSCQIDPDVVYRYRGRGWAVLLGSHDERELDSSFAFTHRVLGYDLADFFSRNSQVFRDQTEKVLLTLLEGSRGDAS